MAYFTKHVLRICYVSELWEYNDQYDCKVFFFFQIDPQFMEVNDKCLMKFRRGYSVLCMRC